MGYICYYKFKYSYFHFLSASTGFSFAAWRAGRYPETRPTMTAKSNPPINIKGLIGTLSIANPEIFAIYSTSFPIPDPRIIPTNPPKNPC